MANTIIIPNESVVYIPIPLSYIGRQVEVTFSLVDEVEKQNPKIKLSDMFRGTLSKESAESFIEHTKIMREEWRDF